MSTTVSSGVWQCGPSDMVAKFLLIAIADNADDFGFAWPSHELLAQKICCDKRTIIRRIEQLEAEGWLRTFRKAVRGRCNAYCIDIRKIGVSVSPTAKKSPLLSRLERIERDSLSPIFLAEDTGDTDEFSGDNPQPRQVTPVQAQVTAEPAQVTLTTEIGDTYCHPNHQEPPISEPPREPSVESPLSTEVPPTPLRGVSGSLADRASEQRWANFKRLLKEDLAGNEPNPVRRRFAEVTPGANDFDTCFAAWWLVDVVTIGDRTEFITEASNVTATLLGVTKYTMRLERVIRTFYAVGKDALTFTVRPLERVESDADLDAAAEESAA